MTKKEINKDVICLYAVGYICTLAMKTFSCCMSDIFRVRQLSIKKKLLN